MNEQSFNPNSLYYGDCLNWIREWKSNCIDLIYLDPPFNSSANYNVLFGAAGNGEAQYRAFNDTWHWDAAASARYQEFQRSIKRPAHDAVAGLHRMLGNCGMLAYLTYMAERLEEMGRVLKPTGSIYLHCDPTASHALKLLMDAIFGQENFRNEIIWRRTLGRGDGKRYGRIHDIILFYTKSNAFTWENVYVYDPEYVSKTFRKSDRRGKYRLTVLTGPGGSSVKSVKPYKGYNPADIGRHWSVPKTGKYAEWIDQNIIPGYREVESTHERLDMLEKAGMIVWSKNGTPNIKQYVDAYPGTKVNDLFLDIPPAPRSERSGYPTQKPLALLERIIHASSKEGDVVLDPFCGCGTAVQAADRLHRRWAGIGISSFAIDLVRERMNDKAVQIAGIPADLASARKLAQEKPFDFESWAIMRLPGFAPNTKQVGDGGVDGRGMLFDPPDDWESQLALAQVKGGRFSVDGLRAFVGVVNNSKAAVGCFITIDPVASREARAFAAAQGTVAVRGQSYPRMNLWSIADYFDNRACPLPPMANPYTGKRIEGTLF